MRLENFILRVLKRIVLYMEMSLHLAAYRDRSGKIGCMLYEVCIYYMVGSYGSLNGIDEGFRPFQMELSHIFCLSEH